MAEDERGEPRPPEEPPRARRLAWSTAIFAAATGLSRIAGLVREHEEVPEGLSAAVRDLSNAVWELAASYDAPSHAEPARR